MGSIFKLQHTKRNEKKYILEKFLFINTVYFALLSESLTSYLLLALAFSATIIITAITMVKPFMLLMKSLFIAFSL